MKDDFLSKLIGNKERAQLLRVFAFNQSDIVTLASAAKRANITSQAAAREMKVLEQLGLVKKSRPMSVTLANGSRRVVSGMQKVPTWMADQDSKLLRPLASFIHEVSPIRYDNIMGALKKSCKISAVILSGTFMGDDTRPADIIVAADPLNERRLEAAIRSLEPSFGRELRFAAFSTPEFRYRLTVQDRLLRDTLDFPHLVLLDRTRLL